MDLVRYCSTTEEAVDSMLRLLLVLMRRVAMRSQQDPKLRPSVHLIYEYAVAALEGRPPPPGPWGGSAASGAADEDEEMGEC